MTSFHPTPPIFVMKKRAIVTGGAGFIGSHLVERLLAENWQVTVIDNFDSFYNESIKRANLEAVADHPDFELLEMDIRDERRLSAALTGSYDVIVHLAAKAGVRPSIADPAAYQSVNLGGTQALLEISRKLGIPQFVFASSSSVYGVNPNVPWSEGDYVLQPISPYASSKIAGELAGHVYSHLYGIRFIGLRFFTVYGPRQRPDLAIHKFAKNILEGKPIPVYGDGSTQRDYTFVGDIVDGIMAAISYRGSQYEIINLGNHRTVSLTDMIATIEQVFGKKAMLQRLPEQPGDVPRTCADTRKARKLLGYAPSTPFKVGVEKFREWLEEVVVEI